MCSNSNSSRAVVVIIIISGSCALHWDTNTRARAHTQVIGLDAHVTVDDEDDLQMARGVLAGVRAHPWLRNARITFVIERNTPSSAYIASVFRTDPLCQVVHEKPAEVAGWNTTGRSKMPICNAGRTLVDRRVLRLASRDTMLCTNPWRPASSRANDTIRAFLDELERARHVVIPPKKANQEAHHTVSAKCSADGTIMQGQNDDMFMAYCLNAYIWERITQRAMPPGYEY